MTPTTWPPDFETDLAFVLVREGGYVNNPHDPGGATNQGVTQRVYDRYRRAQQLSVRSVRLIEAPEVKAIYWSGYYAPVTQHGALTGPRATVAFDTAVNMGVLTAQHLLEQSHGDLETLLELRRRLYHTIVHDHPVLGEFLVGWLQRLRALRRYLHLPPSTVLETDFKDSHSRKKVAA